MWKRKNFWVPCGVLTLVCALIYARSIGFDFLLWDDPLHILKNPFFAAPLGASLWHFWTHAYFNLYIPLAYTVWDLVARISVACTGGLHPGFFHALNVLTHALNACLVYFLLREWIGLFAADDRDSTKRDPVDHHWSWPALAGALLFAVHPVQAAAVGWVSGFKDLGCTTLSLVALLGYSKRPSSPRPLAVAGIAYIGALLIKPSAIVVPAIMGLVEYGTPERKRSGAPLAVPCVGIALGILVAIIDKAAQPNALLSFVPPVHDRLLIALDSLSYYTLRLVDFVSLSPEPGRNPLVVLAQATHWMLLVPIAISTMLWIERKKIPDVARGWVVFVLSLGPMLGFIPFGRQEISTVAEEYLYFPLIGIAWCLTSALVRWNSRRNLAITGAMLLALTGLSMRAVGVWKNSVTFYSTIVKENPVDSVAYNGLGAYALDHKDLNSAYENFSRAVAIKPDFMGTSNLATTLQMLGRYTEMENVLLPVLLPLTEHPESYYANELAREPIIKMAVLEAFAHVQRKEWREAEYYLVLATQFGPQKSGVFFDLGQVRDAQQNHAGALEAYAAACRLEPQNPTFRSRCTPQ